MRHITARKFPTNFRFLPGGCRLFAGTASTKPKKIRHRACQLPDLAVTLPRDGSKVGTPERCLNFKHIARESDMAMEKHHKKDVTPPMESAGWVLDAGLHSRVTEEGEPAVFHALYAGEAFDNPSRGAVAIVARANGDEPGGKEAVQIAVHNFAEGLFGAAPTLSGGVAAERSLAAIHGWLNAQPRPHSRPVSLSAVLFSNRRVGIVHVGNGMVFRRRGTELLRLTAERPQGRDGETPPVQAVGGFGDLRITYLDLPAEVGDRFVLATAGRSDAEWTAALKADGAPENLTRRLIETGDRGRPAALIAIDVRTLPEVRYDDLAVEFSDLPLREPPRDGVLWDGFRIRRTLYRSRWTVLMLAEDGTTGREVVLKIPLPAMLHDDLFRAGFLREAWVGRTVHSPWVCRPIDLQAERRSSLYLVMPYYRGQSLARRIARKPRLSVVESVDIALKLCAAVQSLLDRQIVHRDIKPENVMLSEHGGVTLLDLGMAYLPAIDGPLDDNIAGSTHYMAPELFAGSPAGPRSEVFALAVTLFRMVSGGDYPFAGRDATPPPRLPPGLPRWLSHALLTALSPDPEDRPASPSAFARLLEDGLVRGDTGLTPPQRRRASPLALWRAAALIFAAAFAALLLHDLMGLSPMGLR